MVVVHVAEVRLPAIVVVLIAVHAATIKVIELIGFIHGTGPVIIRLDLLVLVVAGRRSSRRRPLRGLVIRYLRLLENQIGPVDGPDPADKEERGQELQFAARHLRLLHWLIILIGTGCHNGADTWQDDIEKEDYAGDRHRDARDHRQQLPEHLISRIRLNNPRLHILLHLFFVNFRFVLLECTRCSLNATAAIHHIGPHFIIAHGCSWSQILIILKI